MHNFQVTVDGEPPIYSDEQRALLPQATQRDPGVLRRQLRLCAIVALVVLALGLLVLVVYLRRRHGDAAAEPPSAEPASAPAPAAQPAASVPRKTVALAAALSHGAFPVGWFWGTRGGARDRTFKLESGHVLVGSDAACSLRIDDDAISARHCEVRRVDGGFRLLDLGATNGVLVNGRRAREHELVDNDVVTLGRTELKFKCVDFA
jgi:hypothetical protein